MLDFPLFSDYYTQTKKIGEEFIQFLRDRVSIEQSYAKGLNRLGKNLTSFKFDCSFNEGIQSIKLDC